MIGRFPLLTLMLTLCLLGGGMWIGNLAGVSARWGRDLPGPRGAEYDRRSGKARFNGMKVKRNQNIALPASAIRWSSRNWK